jgi:hypothetical protein
VEVIENLLSKKIRDKDTMTKYFGCR